MRYGKLLVAVGLWAGSLWGTEDVNVFADQCRSVLGPLPKINCHAAPILPIYLDGKEVTYETGIYYHGGKATSWQSLKRCDNPSVVNDGSCEPNSRLGVTRSGNVEWLHLCRTLTKQESTSPRYSFVNLIGYNRATGETCFFDATSVSDGVDVPTPGGAGPNDAAGRKRATAFWRPGNVGTTCIQCHNQNGPWIVTPHVAYSRLFGGNGPDLFPAIDRQKKKSPGAAYRVLGVGPVHHTAQAVQPKGEDGGPDTTCTKCHAISSKSRVLLYSVGDPFAKKPNGDQFSPFALAFPQSHWMPDGHGRVTVAEWNEHYAPAVARLKYCMSNDDLKRCDPRRSMATPCPVPIAIDPATIQSQISKNRVELRWTYDFAFGDTPGRDDVRFRVRWSASDGTHGKATDLAPPTFSHASSPGVTYRYQLVAERDCFDTTPNTLSTETIYVVSPPN